MEISNSFGTVIRVSSLDREGVDLSDVLRTLGFDVPVPRHNGLAVVGPVFGGEAASALSDALERVGLSYYEDYYTFEEPFPDWLALIGRDRG